MGRRQQKQEFRAYDYVARPRRSRVADGVEESYWTVRCRRQEDPGEWSLGWFPGLRQAEQAFHKWIDERRKVPIPKGGTGLMTAIIDQYIAMVPTMGKRPNTVANRIFRAQKLRAFVETIQPMMSIGDFDEAMFVRFLAWTRDTLGLRPQTVENLLIGTRTLLRWAAAQGLAPNPPKSPKFRVPHEHHEVLHAEDVEATIAVAAAPLNSMLRLMWETGLRVAEAMTTRGCDLVTADDLVLVRERGTFAPKTPDSDRAVPVTAGLMRDLVALVTTPEAPLFPCDVDRVYHFWRHRMYMAQKAAGVRPFTFHDLRRAVADRLRRGGVPIDRYARFMGHAAVTAVRHYSTVGPGDLHADLEAGLAAARTRKSK